MTDQPDHTTQSRRVVVCLPTYNEAGSLATVVGRIHANRPDVDVLIVDDASPDGTGAIADHLAAADPRVHVLHRREKQGLGAAYLAAFDWGLEEGFDVLVEMDADGSHRPEDLDALLTALDDTADIALGSRWVAGGRIRNWAPHRVLISKAGNVYARTMLRLPLRDVTGGFRAYRASTLAGIGLKHVRSQGYCFQIDLLRRAAARGFRIVESPITFVERQQGVSKMTTRIVVEALIRVTLWSILDTVRLIPRGALLHSRRVPAHDLNEGQPLEHPE